MTISQDLLRANVTPKRLAQILKNGSQDARSSPDYDKIDWEADGGYIHGLLRKAADPRIGAIVHKDSGDYEFDGVVIAVVTKLAGAERLVVEDSRGLLLIMKEKQANLEISKK